MEVFELQRALFTSPFLLFELYNQDLTVKLLGSNAIDVTILRQLLVKLKEWRRGDVWGCIGNGLIEGKYAMLFGKPEVGTRIVRVEGSIKVTGIEQMNKY